MWMNVLIKGEEEGKRILSNLHTSIQQSWFVTYLICKNDTVARSEAFSELYLNTLFVFELCKFSRNFFYLVHENQFWFGITALCV